MTNRATTAEHLAVRSVMPFTFPKTGDDAPGLFSLSVEEF